MPVRGIHDDDVAPGVEQRLGARARVRRATDGRGDAQPTVLIFVGGGVLPALEDVLDGDEALQQSLLVHDGKLFDPVLREQALRLIERRANWCRHQLFFRHDVTNRPVELTLELQIAIGDDADELARAIHNRHARDLEA